MRSRLEKQQIALKKLEHTIARFEKDSADAHKVSIPLCSTTLSAFWNVVDYYLEALAHTVLLSLQWSNSPPNPIRVGIVVDP